jgi:hypothetical protein
VLVGEPVDIETNHKNIDPKKDRDNEGMYNRPELDVRYEDELLEKDLLFSTAPLLVTGSDHFGGRVNYFLKICSNDNEEESQRISDEMKIFKNEIENIKNNNEYICRIYIYNCSNLTSNENTENAFIWIKRYESDEEFKDDKTPFMILSGEVNKVYSLNVLWPYMFDIRIQVHGISSFMGSHSLIGETTVDLERRLFNKTYIEKIKE